MAAPTTNTTGKPCWSREASIGDYGGMVDKVASRYEGTAPYAWFVYRELSALRGTAYAGYGSLDPNTLVHCEHMALARMLAWTWFRQPEQLRANCLPGSSDQGLEYWAQVLRIPTKSSDQRWQVRDRARAHYRAVTEVNLPAIQAAIEELLGVVYVDASFTEGASLSAPPAITFWPGVNDGPASYSLGGGCWASERSHLFVEIQRPAGMTDADFHQLVNVQLFQLLDRLLPAYCTFSYAFGTGFLLDTINQLDFVGLTES